MKIIITARDLQLQGFWLEVCKELSIDEYAVADGRMDPDHELTLTQEQAETIGLISHSR